MKCKETKIVTVILLIILFVFYGTVAFGNAGGGKPTQTIYEPNEIPFTYDLDLAPKVIGWSQTEVGDVNYAQFHAWISRDIPVDVNVTSTGSYSLGMVGQTTDSGGAVDRTYQISYQHDIAQVYYYKIELTVPSYPDVNDVAWIVIEAKEPPPDVILYTWEPPIPEAIVYGSEHTMLLRQKQFQEWVKETGAMKVVK